MWKQVRTACVMLGLLTVLTGIVYPFVVTGVAQVFFPHRANGSFSTHQGAPGGSEFIGQPFTKAEYFWGRPSATSPVPYNAAASSGSNLGPLNPDVTKNASERLVALGATNSPIPADLVTASASGLDPHISPEAAAVQVERVAVARKMKREDVERLVAEHTQGRQLGLLGEPRVNVLHLNYALDRFGAKP